MRRELSRSALSSARRHALIELLDATPDWVLLASADGAIVWKNCALRACTREKSDDAHVPDLFVRSDAPAVERGISEAVALGRWTGTAVSDVARTPKEVDLLVVAYREPDGAAPCLSMLMRSSERERGRELEHLRQVNAELEEFAYAASHDLQEPLRKVKSFCQLLELESEQHGLVQCREYAQRAASAVARLQELIRDLLEHSLAGAASGGLEPVALTRCLTETLEFLAAAIEDADAQIDVGVLPRVLGRQTLLRRAFVNVIGNAIKYRKPSTRPTIRVTAERSAGGWRVCVQDDGIGIAPEHHERVFGAFQRLHARAEYPGTGIGLATVKRAIERCAGRVWLESEPGRGTSVYFALRAAE